MLKNSPEYWMNRCLELAHHAFDLGEVPVGAIVVRHDEVVGQGYNTRELAADPLGHAELQAIASAAENLGRWRLSDCELYVTLEPCVMCAGAIVQARLGGVYYGATDKKGGAVASLYRVLEDNRLNHSPSVRGGILEHECEQILKDFFVQLRAEKRTARLAQLAGY